LGAPEAVSTGPELIVTNGQSVQPDQPLTNNPNVGGFRQKEVEIVLQNPARIQGLITLCIVLGTSFDSDSTRTALPITNALKACALVLHRMAHHAASNCARCIRSCNFHT
jgi:hypothetical protein